MFFELDERPEQSIYITVCQYCNKLFFFPSTFTYDTTCFGLSIQGTNDLFLNYRLWAHYVSIFSPEI
jgi:hypothetical protein